jgi:hypothetical protein
VVSDFGEKGPENPAPWNTAPVRAPQTSETKLTGQWAADDEEKGTRSPAWPGEETPARKIPFARFAHWGFFRKHKEGPGKARTFKQGSYSEVIR